MYCIYYNTQIFLWKYKPSTKTEPQRGALALLGSCHPGSSQRIHPFSPPQAYIKDYITCKYPVSTTIHILFYEKPSPKSPGVIPSLSNPTGTACLIGNPDFWNVFSSTFLLPPAPPGVLKHPRWVYITRIYPNINYPTRNSPSSCATVSATTCLPHLALFISIYWCPLPLPSSPALLHTPALPSGTLSISTTYPLTQRIILVS
jgi:hypothetical protein